MSAASAHAGKYQEEHSVDGGVVVVQSPVLSQPTPATISTPVVTPPSATAIVTPTPTTAAAAAPATAVVPIMVTIHFEQRNPPKMVNLKVYPHFPLNKLLVPAAASCGYELVASNLRVLLRSVLTKSGNLRAASTMKAKDCLDITKTLSELGIVDGTNVYTLVNV